MKTAVSEPVEILLICRKDKLADYKTITKKKIID